MYSYSVRVLEIPSSVYSSFATELDLKTKLDHREYFEVSRSQMLGADATKPPDPCSHAVDALLCILAVIRTHRFRSFFTYPMASHMAPFRRCHNFQSLPNALQTLALLGTARNGQAVNVWQSPCRGKC